MMNPDKDREFDQSMSQLLSLLKKLLKNIPKSGNGPFSVPSDEKDQSVNLNLFFTFFPLAPEELDELEEIYDHYYFQEEKKGEELSNELNQSDLDFLKRHGIQF